ncbi:MAG: sigma-54 dependent transcriptional regulator, partial [bacterium]
MPRSLLIVDDEKNTRDGLKWALESRKLRIALAADGREALDRLKNDDFDLVITDLKMPNLEGLELLKIIRDRYPSTEVVVLTGHGTVESAVDAMKKGAFDYLIKPVNLDELGLLVDRVFEHKELREENEELHQQLDTRYGFHNIIGESEPMQTIYQKIRQVAPTRATVLIQGESGTGKEIVANAIHYNSPRKHRPFVKINCGALSPTLLESELFGHEKGAFTNAIRQKAGRFELADGGSLFLDEISETTPDFQVKLLRVLQEQSFERVGGTSTITVDVRIITATNKDLESLVKEGKFREDLFYRLNVIQINAPPLRDRPDDIPLLINAFVKEFCELNQKPLLKISPRVMNILQNYSWPGNVRELRNVLEGMVVLATTTEITPKQLPERLREEVSGDRTLRLRVGATVKDMEKELIRATLQE